MRNKNKYHESENTTYGPFDFSDGKRKSISTKQHIIY
jgi:hypothetical protein